MGPLEAIVYGIVQGLTEFLPVSSSAHLRLTPVLFGWQDPGAAFTAVIQLGTTLAVLIYFAKDLGRAISAWAKSLAGGPKDDPDARLGWAVFFGTIPIVVVGFLLRDSIETTFRSLYVVASAMLLMSAVMFVMDRLPEKRSIETVTVNDGVIVGLWQCLALLPGMSRSGSTISGARALGYDRVAAARFSFLLGVPSITLAGLYEAVKERKNLDGAMLTPVAIATVVSFIVGYASIYWLMRFVQKRGIAPFVVYRVAIALLLIGLLATGRLSPDAGLPH
ncbi:undecaprenyl-diphosphate phosphatase [bacterium]|nr:MAG: undecaprenyl-diphosphate phosphatase [bacterium]